MKRLALMAIACIGVVSGSPAAHAGSYVLDSVSYYASDSVSEPFYSCSSTNNSVTASGEVRASGSQSGSTGYASANFGVSDSTGGSISKYYRWESTGSYDPPAEYDVVQQGSYTGTASSTSTGGSYASASGNQVSGNQTVSTQYNYRWHNSGSSSISVYNYGYLSTSLSASASTGAANAAITQSASYDANIE